MVENLRTSKEPQTPLGEHAKKMTSGLPEGVRAIVMLTMPDGACVSHTTGYGDEEVAWAILGDLVGHSGAVLTAMETGLGVVLVPKKVADAVGPLVRATLIEGAEEEKGLGGYL